MLPNSLTVSLESREVPSSLLCVCLASALQRYYSIEQQSFYFWLTMDNLALNPWPEYCLNVKRANPNELADSASPSQPCLWPRLLRAAAYVGEKQGLSQVVRRELGPAAWHPLGASGTPSGTPGRVFVNSVATCMQATWGLGRLNLQTRERSCGERSNWGKQVRMLPFHLFPK